MPLIAAAFYLLNLVVNVPLTVLVYPSLGLAPVALTALTALTYGLCEEVARWLSFKVGPLVRHRDGDGGVAAGLGHGGMESVLFAAPYAIGTVVALVNPSAPCRRPPGTRWPAPAPGSSSAPGWTGCRRWLPTWCSHW